MKYVYLFREGNGKMRELLGGKGANLAEMTNLGLPVPQGFTITTEACTKYYEDGRMINADIQAEIMQNIDKLEALVGKKVIVVRNLKEATLRGEKSYGMILCASDKANDKLEIIEIKGLEPGDIVS